MLNLQQTSPISAIWVETAIFFLRTSSFARNKRGGTYLCLAIFVVLGIVECLNIRPNVDVSFLLCFFEHHSFCSRRTEFQTFLIKSVSISDCFPVGVPRIMWQRQLHSSRMDIPTFLGQQSHPYWSWLLSLDAWLLHIGCCSQVVTVYWPSSQFTYESGSENSSLPSNISLLSYAHYCYF